MDIRGLANGATSTVNPNETVTVLSSLGSMTDPATYKQTPIYDIPVTGPAQIQALNNSELRLIDGLNLQGDIRAIYFKGNLAAVVRPNQKGGTIVKRGFPSQDWLVVKVLETWPTWSKAVIVLQTKGPNA